MANFGQVFALLAALAGLSISIWGLVLLAALFFPGRCAASSQAMTRSPWRSLLIGLLIELTLGLLGAALLQSPDPGAKLLGLLVLLPLLAIVAVGAGGMAMVAAERLRVLDSAMTDYGALSRGSLILVAACLVPVLGWYAVLPAVTMVALGAGAQAILHRRPRALPESG